MKRILCLVLSLFMLFSLAACSSPKVETVKEEKTEGEDLSELDGEMLYRYGEDKMRALTSARYTTQVLFGAEKAGEFETVRIRRGYDGFIYSCSGQNFYSFDGENAYMENEVGAYTSPATIRTFGEFMTEFIFPVCGLDPDLLENFSRDGDSVSYECSKAELIGLYQLAEKPEFVPDTLKGVAFFDEEGVIVEERITLGSGNGECVLKTVLSEYRSDAIKIAEPSSPDAFTAVEDIALPMRLQSAILGLYEQKEIQTTSTSYNTVTLGEASYVYYEDINTCAKEDAGAYYISHQTLKRVPELPDESIFTQALLSGGRKAENSYNVILGEKLWEKAATAQSLPWKNEISAIMPALSDLQIVSVSRDVGGYSVSFQLTEEAAKRVSVKVLGLFPESGIAQPAPTLSFYQGTLSVDDARGIVTAISYTVEGSFAGETGNGEYTGQYSVLVDATEGVVLPELQVPTPTTPGMEVEHGEH